MDWEQQVIKLIEIHFKSIGIRYLPTLDIQRCLIDFMNLDLKLIQAKPRYVFKSDILKSRKLLPKYQKALNYIENKIKGGVDIMHHMSIKVLDPTYNDLLMNDWVIQHLHLSDTRGQNGQKFYDRSKYLLFIIFSENQAFLIDIQEHQEQDVFAKQEFLDIIDRNWPNLLQVHNHPEAEFFKRQYSDTDVNTLRKKGYTIGTTAVNGKIIINPGFGITSSGHNIHVVKRAHSVIRYLYDSVQEVEKD